MTVERIKSNETVKECAEAVSESLSQLIDAILTTENELDPYPLQSILGDLNQTINNMDIAE